MGRVGVATAGRVGGLCVLLRDSPFSCSLRGVGGEREIELLNQLV